MPWLLSCGLGSSHGGLNSQVLVLVTDAAGQPVAGATVWVPADSAALVEGKAALEGAALTDAQGLTCADPPEPALFSACTGSDGIALLECGGDSVFLLKYRKDAQEGIVNGRCGQEGVVQAPL